MIWTIYWVLIRKITNSDENFSLSNELDLNIPSNIEIDIDIQMASTSQGQSQKRKRSNDMKKKTEKLTYEEYSK